jgi:hypothetical protein
MIKYLVVILIAVRLTTKTDSKIQLPHFQIPKDVGGYLDSVIETYYKLAKPATPKEYYEANRNLKGFAQAQRGLFFLKFLGIMEAAERGRYKLSTAGTPIGQHLKAKRTEDAKRSWQKLLMEHSLYGKLRDYFKGAGEVGTGEGFGDYLSKHGADVDQKYVRSGGQKLCMLFASKGLIRYKEDDDTFTLEEVKAPVPTPPSGKTPPEAAVTPGAAMSYHIEININVDASTPPELASKLFEFYWTTKKPESGKK